jgi:predicted HTH transcriptional regulator
VQKIGYGIAQARKKLKANNNPDVEFNPNKNENYVSAIVRSSMGVPIS